MPIRLGAPIWMIITLSNFLHSAQAQYLWGSFAASYATGFYFEHVQSLARCIRIEGQEAFQEEYRPSDLKCLTNGRSDLTGMDKQAFVALQDDWVSKQG